jgi:hypothetical protein
MGENNSNHNLEEAGNTLGKLYNVNKYDSSYGGKRGMKFFGWAVVVVFFASLLILMIRPYGDIGLVYADEEQIVVYELKINILGSYKVKEEHLIEYPENIAEYRYLTGKPAETARAIVKYEAEVAVCSDSIIRKLPASGLITNPKLFVYSGDHDKILVYDFEHNTDLMYGMPVNKGFRKVDLTEMEYLCFTGFAASIRERTAKKLVRDLTTLEDAE